MKYIPIATGSETMALFCAGERVFLDTSVPASYNMTCEVMSPVRATLLLNGGGGVGTDQGGTVQEISMVSDGHFKHGGFLHGILVFVAPCK